MHHSPLRSLRVVAAVVLAATITSPLGSRATVTRSLEGGGRGRHDDTTVTRLSGHVLPALARAERIATTDHADDPLTLTFVLTHDDEQGFATRLREIEDPAAPSYQRYLTQTEIADRFGPSRATYDRLEAHLRARGLAVVPHSPFVADFIRVRPEYADLVTADPEVSD